MADIKDITVPDIGDFDSVEVIEIFVSPGDTIAVEDALVSLESDKAAMEIPSPEAGIVKEIVIKVGDKVSQGALLIKLEPSAAVATDAPTEQAPAAEAPVAAEPPKAEPAPVAKPPVAAAPNRPSPTRNINTKVLDDDRFRQAHASPAVRKFARELGADLGQMTGSGIKDRILKDDVKAWVKQALTNPSTGGLSVEPMPDIDFSLFGDIETLPLSRINKLTGKFLHRNWVNIPHVTQFDEADITELEKFRKQLNEEHGKDGIRVTVLAFMMKALVSAIKEHPRFNSSLDASGENLILKNTSISVSLWILTQDWLCL